MKFWNHKRTESAKKHLFEILFGATLLVVVVQIVLVSLRGDSKADGVIIRETQTSEESEPVIHIARTLGSRYLPSTAEGLNPNHAPAVPIRDEITLIGTTISEDEIEPDVASESFFMALPSAIPVESQESSDRKVENRPLLDVKFEMLPAALTRLKGEEIKPSGQKSSRQKIAGRSKEVEAVELPKLDRRRSSSSSKTNQLASDNREH